MRPPIETVSATYEAAEDTELTILRFAGYDRWTLDTWDAICSCGARIIVDGSLLRRGLTPHCAGPAHR